MELNEEFIASLALDADLVIKKISQDLEISEHQVRATVSLFKEGDTIPFISRYRKEVTGSLDEVQVREISHKLAYHENMETRRIEVIRSIFSQEKLTEDLYKNILKCQTLSELESLYAPYKKKKKTRAMIAIEKGLGPLSEEMLKLSASELEKEALKYIDPEKGVNDKDEALQGAMDIVAEQVSQDMDQRTKLKTWLIKTAKLVVNGEGTGETSVYKMYYDFAQPIGQLKPHMVLAINRGEKEGELKSRIEFDWEEANAMLEASAKIHNFYHKAAISDGLKRLLVPSLEREIRSDLHDQSDKHGINVFSTNLRDLLMSPPIKGTRVMGIDPGIRTGTKIVCLSETGQFLHYFMIYQHKEDESAQKIAEFAKKYNVELIAVGNGTGSHEVQQVVAKAIQEHGLNLQYTVVAEDGASVYSASEIAREEFPDLDLTVRGAISIGRRLQDPLSELVKIDPQSIGVGLYQHDLNQKALGESLDEVVESVVNKVGVNLNTASFSLLKYVSGISTSIAKNIVQFRDQHGVIADRASLNKISGMGPKSFEQCAGFLKIPESKDILDNTWVHPENYPIAREILQAMQEGGILTKDSKSALMEKYKVSAITIDDIVAELKKPNRDPREDYPLPILQKGVVEFKDLKVGMKVTGKVKNVVDFGAFVDIGIKETALVHVSELSDTFVKNPMDVIKVGDVKEFVILEMDEVRKRIGLSLKTAKGPTPPRPKLEIKKPAEKKEVKREKDVSPASYAPKADNFSYNPFKDLLGK